MGEGDELWVSYLVYPGADVCFGEGQAGVEAREAGQGLGPLLNSHLSIPNAGQACSMASYSEANLTLCLYSYSFYSFKTHSLQAVILPVRLLW